jgi:Fe-S-cluster containining protein
MEPDLTPIRLNEAFRFTCSPQVSCFNACCRDLNQMLTPYDILRLKNGLKIPSDQFLKVYARQHVGPETGLPVITLKPQDTKDLLCQFVTPKGCRVYPDRPASCRIYPLARAISRDRKSGSVRAHFALLKEDHCCGHQENGTQTVQQWITDQELTVYNRHNDKLIEIIALKNQFKPGPLDLVARRQFQLAMYDLDNFREKLSNADWLSAMSLPADLIQDAMNEDLALLRIAYIWVAAKIFEISVSAATDLFA